jgi:hypothetical protein
MKALRLRRYVNIQFLFNQFTFTTNGLFCQIAVLDAEGKRLGTLKRHEALQMAKKANLDLILISAAAKVYIFPPHLLFSFNVLDQISQLFFFQLN